MLAIECLERSKILKTYICLTILTLLFFSTTISQWKLEPTTHAFVQEGIDLILRQEYDRADSVFKKISEYRANSSVGYLYQVAVLLARSIDYELSINRVKFDSLLELSKKNSDEENLLWGKYFFATAYGYDAYERVESGDWFGGVRKGMTSASKYEDIISYDSSFYDAYAGIGTYYYWRSRKTEFLHWLPFIKDDRELGIKLLVICATKSEYNRYTAISALISIFLDAEDYVKAEYWSKKGLEDYPENRVFLWGFATALDRQKKYTEAVSAYESLLENILNAQFPNPYGEIVCRLNLVKCKIAIDNIAGIELHLNKILAYKKYSFPAKLTKRAEAKFIEAKKIYSSIQKK